MPECFRIRPLDKGGTGDLRYYNTNYRKAKHVVNPPFPLYQGGEYLLFRCYLIGYFLPLFIMAHFRAAIRIQLRKQILDVQGKTVENALHSLNFDHLTDVHIGKYVELTVAATSKDAALASVEDACKKLIANPIMEDYQIDLVEL
jgi:phosphoribosylformylglycinamidine synthase PurS subunit